MDCYITPEASVRASITDQIGEKALTVPTEADQGGGRVGRYILAGVCMVNVAMGIQESNACHWNCSINTGIEAEAEN